MVDRAQAELFVVGRFPPPLDGQTIATRACAEALASAFRVHAIDTEPGGVDPLNAFPAFSLRRATHYLRLRRRLRRAVAASPGAPIIWHAISPAPLGHLRDVIATLPAFAPRRPVVAVVHRAGLEKLFETAHLRFTARRLAERVDIFVFQNETLSRRLDPWIDRPRRLVIPNTIAPDLVFSRLEVERRLHAYDGRRPVRLLFLGNLLPEKGYREVLLAARLLHAEAFTCELTVAGRWPSSEARDEAVRLAEGQPIRILDGVDQRTARRLHAEADVFLLPTYHPTESQPIALIEALGSGTPIISADRDVIRDILRDEVEGRLVPPRNPEAIARAVRSITGTPDSWRRMAGAARDRFDACFAPEAVEARWRDLARRLIAQNSANAPAGGTSRSP